jgi:ferric-dicitrate binding protein FerR (iron transport regulator)
MKTNDNIQLNDETIAKYLSGEMSEMEVHDFEKEIAVSEKNMLMIEKMKKQWSAMEAFKAPKVPDTRKAWDKLYTRLDNEKLIPVQIAREKLVSRLMKAAAVMIVLLSISAVVYFVAIRKTNQDMVKIDTGSESGTLIKTLTDGSVIYIAQNSLFSFPVTFEKKSRNVELKGEAFFDIMPNPEKPFIIETDEVIIQVLGTAFNVNTRNENSFELIVDRGKVKVTLKKDPSHSEYVVAGEKLTASEHNLVKSTNDKGKTQSWYKERMRFKDEPLQNTISVLNRNFNTTFVLANKDIGNRKYTVTFHNETPETMTELICATLNLKSQTINGSVVLSENNENAKRN